MRLIDADAYAAEMKKRQDACMDAMESASYDGELFSPKEHWEGVLAAFAEAKLTLDDMPTIGGWVSVKDRMPDSNHVLARCEIHGLYKPKSYTCVAFYAKKNSISVGNCFDDEICCEYDEETDEYYLKEGWYEVIRNWDDYGSVVIGDFVTHWMPLPEPPKENEDD